MKDMDLRNTTDELFRGHAKERVLAFFNEVLPEIYRDVGLKVDVRVDGNLVSGTFRFEVPPPEYVGDVGLPDEEEL